MEIKDFLKKKKAISRWLYRKILLKFQVIDNSQIKKKILQKKNSNLVYSKS